MYDKPAFEDTPEGELVLRFHTAIWSEYGGESAAVPLEDVLSAIAWLLFATLAQRPSESRERTLARFGDTVPQRLNDGEAPLN